MRPVTIIFLLLSFKLSSFAQQISFNRADATTSHYYTEIPYEEVNGKLFISATINGKSVKCLFDTGAPCQLSNDVISCLKVSSGPKLTITDAFGHADSSKISIVDGIQLGNITFNQVAVVPYFPDLYKCWNIGAVIGANIFHHSVVQINSDKHLIIITDDIHDGRIRAKNSVPMKLDSVQSYPLINCPISKDKVTYLFGFDTGATELAVIPDYYMQFGEKYKTFEKLDVGYGANMLGGGGAQEQATKYRLKAAYMQVAGTRLNHVTVETEGKSSPRIGSKLLDYGIVTIDFVNHRFYFDSKESSIEAGEQKWSSAPFIVDNKLVVGLVWSDSKGKLEVGEQILAIDGKDFSTVSLCDWITHKPVLEGKETATLTIKTKDGKTKLVEIKRQ